MHRLPSMAQHACAAAARTYRRRRPETTVLHRVVREHYQTVLQRAREQSESGFGLPAYVEREFSRYLGCGDLGRGFGRLVCTACRAERLVGFSCKGRLCPSCASARMAMTAQKLVADVLPLAAYRQWTLSFPWRVRLLLLRDKKLLGQVLSIFQRVVFSYQRRLARRAGVADPLCGSLTFLHRFDSQLRPNAHFHSFVPDGVFNEAGEGGLAFCALPPPSDEDVQRLVLRIACRVERACTSGALMTRRRLWTLSLPKLHKVSGCLAG
jgi:hypothetical protein